MPDPVEVVVCGTRFGEHYLSALAALRHQAAPRYRLAGIVARGSERSRSLAAHLGVPLYPDVASLPVSVEVACVVVRSAIVGGDGSSLARGLLERGIHVLQEHPVHPTDCARLKALGAAHGACYHINTFYPHLPAGQRFIDYARRSAAVHAPWFVEITTSLQLLYSSLDLVGRALGGAAPFQCVGPLALGPLASQASAGRPWPFRALQGLIGGVPFSLNLQTYLDAADPDHHSLVMHRIAIGGPQGNVLLANSYGPVLWSHPIYAPDYHRHGAEASYLLAPEAHRASRFNQLPTALPFGPAGAPSLGEASLHDFPHAILAALDELLAQVEAARAGAPDPARDSGWLAHGQAWLDIMRAVGQPVSVSLSEPPVPHPDPTAYARHAS
ncbi:thiazolinyl imide reductase [Burkholderia gladioli]|uniref:Putative siderophore-like synthase protein n=1 Tax=Burkholderia gladioli (strain BSR3) TaxID=999541 RepID=F2LSV6_BURGS|nr:thiazolinyl imide reductase [Burkholderia gladioli]AEA65976.1 putative siderophore-like synthase protein [Burkholderia gladioli BSR3]